jgi:hypothetical protein
MKVLEKRYGTPEKTDLYEGIVACRICPLSGAREGTWCNEGIDELFVSGTEPSTVCSYHTAGGIAYPPEFHSWAEENGQRTIVAGTTSGNDRQKLQIVYPDNESVFLIDPVLDSAYQTIGIVFSVPASISCVEVFIDLEKHVLHKEPFSFRWRLKKGNHTVMVRSPTDTTDSERITFSVL